MQNKEIMPLVKILDNNEIDRIGFTSGYLNVYPVDAVIRLLENQRIKQQSADLLVGQKREAELLGKIAALKELWKRDMKKRLEAEDKLAKEAEWLEKWLTGVISSQAPDLFDKNALTSHIAALKSEG